MYRKNIYFQITARVLLALFLSNTVAPTLQFTFADSTQYYVDATGGNDGNDGLSPATAWQTTAKVNGSSFLQGDTLSFLCSETWTGSLNLNTLPGTLGLPITINSYGSCIGDTPTLEGINITGSSYVVIDGIDVSNTLPGNIVSIDSSNNVSVVNSTISGTNATCTNVTSSSGILIDGNMISICQNAMSISGSEAVITNNTISAILGDAIHVSSAFPVDVSYNTFLNVAESAILFGSDTDVLRNNITTVCTTGTTECAAIRSSPYTSGSITSTIVENSIKDVGTGVRALANAGILASGVSGADIEQNGIQNAQYAVRLIDTSNSTITQNTLVSSRINTLSVIQNNTGAVSLNSFTGNTFVQRAPDYPYIEFRDEVPGSGIVGNFVTFDSNSIFPNYKPNTSFARTIKFGGETQEFTKAELNMIDSNITKFEYFAYKPYVNTGSYATANLLTNGNFTSDASNWTPSALTGSAPILTHNPTGSHIGGSATITPAGGSADRIWATNDAILSVTSGQVFHVTGYAKSGTGNINLRAFLHASGDKTNIYSDRIAETYASSTGRLFSFYITATTTAADAQFTLETSNNDVAYEIDEVSFRRLAAHVKNTNTYEVLTFENPTGFVASEPCPGGAQCAAYVDGLNVTTSWPLSVPAYSTTFVLWNNSPNLLIPPTCTLNFSPGGSISTGQPVTAIWDSAGSFLNTLTYQVFTGTIQEVVAESGSTTFIPPDGTSTVSLNLINDVGPYNCSAQVTASNTPPYVYGGTTTGTENDPQVDGTLSGIDLNPGDSIFFEKLSDPTYGVINVDSSGSIQYFPNPDFCGIDSFDFRAIDQFPGHYSDPATQNIDIACINNAPVAVDDSGTTNGPMIPVDVLANDTDPDSPYQSQTLSIFSFTQPQSGSVVQNGNNLEYTPNSIFSGSDIFSYRIQDQSGVLSSNTGIVTMHVLLPNAAPQSYNMNLTINEDIPLVDVLSGSDINGDVLSFTSLTLPFSGGLNLLANGSFTYTPASDIYGSDTFDFIANDGFFDSNTGTVTITITSVPDTPIGVDDSYSVNQDTSISVPVLSNDYDVDSISLSITGITIPSNGNAILSGSTIYYTPNIGYFGPDSFTYQVEDDTSLVSTPVNVDINVAFTNAPPTANPTSFSVNEDATLTGVVTGSDPELSTLTFFLDSTTSNGVLTFTSTGGVRYIPGANYNGVDTFTFHVSDGVLTSTAATVNITVNPINDVPTANTTTITALGNSVVSGGHAYTGFLTGNDIEGSSLTFTAATLPTHGILSMTSTGYITYTPAVGYIGSDSFSFRVNDGTVNSANASVSINVTSNGVPIPLGSFTVISPVSTYSGSTFGVTVQARDLAGSIMTTYTGSITFTSTDPLAVLPSSGASISFSPLDAGVKTFSNSTVLRTIGTMKVIVTDTVISGASGSANIAVSEAPISVPFGPGGAAPAGGGVWNYGSGNEQNQVYGSAPVLEPTTHFVFVGEGAELLNKLMLVNRIVNQDGTLGSNPQLEDGNSDGIPNIPGTPGEVTQTYLMGLNETDLMDDISTLTLRVAFWDHLHYAAISNDPDSMLENARTKLNSFSFDGNDRLTLVRDVLLRILDSQQRKYREIVDRDVSLSSPNRNDDSEITSDDTTDTLLDMSDTDLSEIDLSELNLTEEELAILQEGM